MRYFTYNGSTPKQQIKGYCHTLENDITSLINYIDYFTPNYKILNYTPRLSTQYYSNDELIAKNYILPIKIIPMDDFLDPLIDLTDDKGQIKGEDSLIVFPSYLKLHEGLLNRFPEYDHSRIGVLLYYGTIDNLLEAEQLRIEAIENKNLYFIPDTILSLNWNDPLIQVKAANSDPIDPFYIQIDTKNA